jgi:hypothetical protein
MSSLLALYIILILLLRVALQISLARKPKPEIPVEKTKSIMPEITSRIASKKKVKKKKTK